MNSFLGEHDEDAEELKKKLRQANQTIRNIKNVLYDIEWDAESNKVNTCPWCGNYQKDGHEPDCKLNKVLNAS